MIALGQLAKGGDINKLIYPDIRKEALARIGIDAVDIAGLDPAIHLLHENIVRRDGPRVKPAGDPIEWEGLGFRSDAAWVR